MSCIRDNKICTKCCEVIHIPQPKQKGWYSHELTSDTGFIAHNWKQIKCRVAKKKNPWMFKVLGDDSKNMYYYSCKNLTKNGCGVYNNRPHVCSGYPKYNRSELEFAAEQIQRPCSYTPSCTVYYEIPVVNIY